MSATLFMQSVLGGALTGGLYGLLAIGLSLSWGLLRLVNISHFALAFLGAYITYQLGTSIHLAPWWSALIIVPSFFVFGVGLHWGVRLTFPAFAFSLPLAILILFIIGCATTN